MSDDFEYQLRQEFNEKCSQQVIKDGIKDGIKDDNSLQINNTYRDPNDGTEYEWNQALKAWVPKIDDDFIARYQSNYGYFAAEDNNTNTNTLNKEKSDESDSSKHINSDLQSDEVPEPSLSSKMSNDNKKLFVSKLLNKRKAEPKADEWFEISDDHNTKVYVSNLPLNTTEEEFLELMKKCGLIEKDDRNELKIKLYRDSNGQIKGDGLCTYIKIESVELALNILDGYHFKDKTIVVERAKFALKGHYNPSLKPKRQKKDKQKEKKKLEKY